MVSIGGSLLAGVGNPKPAVCVLWQLLDELSYTTKAASCPQPRLAAVAQCIYDKFGKKITNVMSLIPKKDDRGEKEDAKVWVSYGEPFISPFSKSRGRAVVVCCEEFACCLLVCLLLR